MRSTRRRSATALSRGFFERRPKQFAATRSSSSVAEFEALIAESEAYLSLEQGWKMTAVAAKLCEHPGAYAMSTGPLQMFLMFREVHLDRFEIAP